MNKDILQWLWHSFHIEFLGYHFLLVLLLSNPLSSLSCGSEIDDIFWSIHKFIGFVKQTFASIIDWRKSIQIDIFLIHITSDLWPNRIIFLNRNNTKVLFRVKNTWSFFVIQVIDSYVLESRERKACNQSWWKTFS